MNRSENREHPLQQERQRKPLEQQPLGAAESQRTFKEPTLQSSGKIETNMPKLAQMRLTSANTAKTSFR